MRSASDFESGKETVPSQLPCSRSLNCWPTRLPAALYERSLEKPSSHALPVFAESVCEHAGGRLDVKSMVSIRASET